jgi:AcrR family transcriptional regulator
VQNIIPEMENNVPAQSEAAVRGVDRALVDRTLEGRRAAYEAEVRRFIEAAFVLIQRSGRLEPRVSEIVAGAGLSNQAFYRHFRSKHELLVAVLDRGVGILASYLAHRMESEQTPLGRIRQWLAGMSEQALHPEAASATRPFVLARGRLAEVYPEEVAASERRLEALVEAELVALAAERPGAGVVPRRDAETLYHLAMGWMEARLREGSSGERTDAGRLVDFALGGLLRKRSGGA